MSRTIRLATTLMVGLALALILSMATETGVVFADDQPDGSTIDPDQDVDGVWGPGTITATADVTIQSGVVITVAPGTMVHMADGVGLTVNGDLHSDGSVTFTTASAPATPGAWTGITYADGSNGYLSQAIVEYAVHAVTLDTSNPVTISNSELRYNRHATTTNNDAYGAGLTIMRGDHLIDHTDIYSNSVETSYNGADVYGGGVDIRGGNSKILSSRVYENSASTATSAGSSHGGGGGILIRAGNPIIQYCDIMSNTLYTRRQDYTYSGAGAGIGIYGNTQAEIRNNWIANNINTSRAASGGGIGFRAGVSARIIDGNVIAGNAALTSGWYGEGGGIDDWGGSTFIASNNLIYNNTTNGEGGGIATWRADNARVYNNTFISNTASFGGAIYRHRGYYYSNVVVGNTTTSGGSGAVHGCSSSRCGYNDVWNNLGAGGNYSGSPPSTDVQVDPLFVGTGDLVQQFHIIPSSPVVDAGADSGTGLPDTDYDGDPRPVYGGYDIGFDEVSPDLKVVKSADPDLVEPDGVISYTVVVANEGVGDAAGVAISDTVPAGTQFVVGSIALDPAGAGTEGTAPPMLATDVQVDAGERVTVTYAVTVDHPMAVGARITNTASVTCTQYEGGAVGSAESIVINVPPVAVDDDDDSTDEDSMLNVGAPGVLSNDTDLNGDAIEVADYDATSANGASVNVTLDGSYSYDPTGAAALQALAVGETLEDTFTYTAEDGHDSTDTATVTVTVSGVNDGPTAVDDGWTVDEDTVLDVAAPGVLLNDDDPDTSDVLSVSDFDAVSVQGASVSMSADGSYSYDPTGLAVFQELAVGETLVDVFTYTLSDSQGVTDTATVSVTVAGVNDDPSADGDTGATDEDTALNVGAPGVLLNDDDTDASDALTVSDFDAASLYGADVSVNVDGSYSYDPVGAAALQALAVGEMLEDTFSYTAGDGHGGTDTATVTITVSGVNDAPVVSGDVYSISRSDTLMVDADEGVLANDTDAEGDVLTATLVSDVSHGTLMLNADGSFVYEHDGGESTSDSFTYRISDGAADSGDAVVTLTITTGNYPIYLPCVVASYSGPAPDPSSGVDLVVEKTTVTSSGVEVVIKNQGSEAVTAEMSFWVDLYVNPHPVPTMVNQTWDELCSEGMVWGVASPALPLESGEELTLTNGGVYYWPEYSNFTGAFAAGVSIYVQVDSANDGTTYGAVLESHEVAGGAYNNVSGPVYLTGVAGGVPVGSEGLGTGGQGDADADADQRRSVGIGSDHLPPRP